MRRPVSVCSPAGSQSEAKRFGLYVASLAASCSHKASRPAPDPVGTAIVLTVSTPEMVVVPRVVDLQRADAFTAIASTGLKVGRVARRLSLSAGGTIVAQELQPGVRVEFGTSVAVDEALPRYIWMAPSATVLAVAGFVGIRKRRAKNAFATSPSETHAPVPPLNISVKPNIHLGEADVHRDDARAIRLEVQIGTDRRPVGSGHHRAVRQHRQHHRGRAPISPGRGGE